MSKGARGRCCKDSNECRKVGCSAPNAGAPFVMAPVVGGMERSQRERSRWGGSVAASGWCDSPKGTRWMSWRQEAMKDAVTCEKPRGAGKRAEILGYPNGATHPPRGGYLS